MDLQDDQISTEADGALAPGAEPVSDRQEPREKAQDAPKDLRSQLRNSIDQHKSPARQAAAQQRAREAETGRFDRTKPAEPQEPSAQSGVQNSKEGKPSDAPPAPTPDKAQSEQPPEALTKGIRDAWPTLSPEVRAEFIRRETDSAKGVAQLKERYKPIEDTIAPYRPLLQQMGKTEGEAIKQLFDWQNALAGPNKVDAARALLKAHNIDLSSIAAGHTDAPRDQSTQKPQEPQQPAIDLSRYDQEIGALKSQFQRQQDERVARELSAFAKDKPHFEAVRVHMGHLMGAGLATSLDDAYEQAIWSHPETRAAIQQEEVKKREAQAAAEAERARNEAAEAERKRRDDAEKARRAGGASPRGGSPTGGVSAHRQVGKSVGSDLRDAIRGARGAV